MSIVDYFKVKKNNGIVKKDPFAKFVDKDAYRRVKELEKAGKHIVAPPAKTQCKTCYPAEYDMSIFGISKVENGVLMLQDKGLDLNDLISRSTSINSSVEELTR